MSFRYSVVVTFTSSNQSDAYITWLRGGHMSQVCIHTTSLLLFARHTPLPTVAHHSRPFTRVLSRSLTPAPSLRSWLYCNRSARMTLPLSKCGIRLSLKSRMTRTATAHHTQRFYQCLISSPSACSARSHTAFHSYVSNHAPQLRAEGGIPHPNLSSLLLCVGLCQIISYNPLQGLKLFPPESGITYARSHGSAIFAVARK